MGGAGMARGEGQIAGLRIRRRITQIAGFAVERAAVTIDPHIADIEVVARELEIVGIAAEERDRLLGREHQPHVLVTAALVESVEAALIERDDGATGVPGVAGAISRDCRLLCLQRPWGRRSLPSRRCLFYAL